MRNFPPVPPVPRPERLSQTLLKHMDRCPRAAYLYLKHGGGAASHAMYRGSLFHLFVERTTMELVVRGEKTLYAPQPGEDAVAAAREVASMTKGMVDELARERPDLLVPAAEMDRVRTMAYHWAVGMDFDPEQVVGVERKFVLDLDCGWTISGKVDLATFLRDSYLGIDDYKTSMAVPAQEAFDESFQQRLYALLVLFGFPVEKVDGVEVRLEPVGEHVAYVRGREVYPRAALRADGSMVSREKTWSRTEIADFRLDVERTGEGFARALETGDWPAVAGPHCSECPAPAECPIPKHLRRFAGSINTPDQAAEAWAWAMRVKDDVAATEREVKAFVKAREAPVRVGDVEYDFEVTESRALRKRGRDTDWDGLQEAVVEATTFGTPFDVADWIRTQTRTVFKGRPVAADNERENDDGDHGGAAGGSLGERFGDDAPF